MSDLINKKDVTDYLSLFPELVLEILEDVELKDIGAVRQWAARVLYKNVPNNEILHGLATCVALRNLIQNPTSQQLKDAYVIGWILQMFSSCYFILDDIFDDSTTRHFTPCWHLIDGGLGKLALIDIAIIESCVYKLLKKYFSHTKYYIQLLNTFHDLSFKMAQSQNLELRLTKAGPKNAAIFNASVYKTLVNYKMCYYPTCIHVMAALNIAGIHDKELIETSCNILHKIDFQFQVRDDYLDVYGDNKKNESEIGNDIEEGRSSWNIITSLQIPDEQIQQKLLENYGRKDGIEIIKDIYNQIDLPKIFQEYEKEKYDEIMSLISALPPSLPSKLFIDMLWASFPDQMSSSRNKDKNGDDDGRNENSKSLIKFIPEFLGVFPELVYDLIFDPDDPSKNELKEIEGWIGRLFQYNVPHGKKTRGLTIPLAYKMLGFGDSPEDLQKCYILGWCLEMLQAAALIADDVMDVSSTRRGRPCWYKLPEIGLEALNDATLLESAIYKILRVHFNQMSYYTDLLELFQDITYKTAHGQALDVQTGMSSDITLFTKERYNLIVKYKTSYYTFILPIAITLAMIGVKASTLIHNSFLLNIGHFFQVQDDFLDCFGNSEQTGKIGTDIADSKCTWLIVQALEIANSQQKQFLIENYGVTTDDPENVQAIKKLYEDMELPQQYYKYEHDTYNELINELEAMEVLSEGHKELLLKILETTLNRKS